jgi:enoyl-CoA hydratase
MDYQNIIFEKEMDIAVVTFNRPKALNALNMEVLAEISDCLDRIAGDEDIRALILTGAGDKAFVAGADIKFMSTLSPLDAKKFAAQGQEVLFKLESLPVPVIASVNGFALGGGNEIAMACDFIYASEKAQFGQPEINLGVIPGFGGTQRLSRLVGKGLAKELCLTGEMINAKRALEIGLVNKVFPTETLLEETKRTAKVIAQKGRVSIRGAKKVIDSGYDVDLRNALAMEADAFGLCFASEDQKEGMAAFIEKRKPVFKGKL